MSQDIEPDPFADKVTPTSKPEALVPVGEDQKKPTQSFEEFMKKPTQTSEVSAERKALISPLELPGKQSMPTSGPSYKTLGAQINATQETANDLKNQLQTPNLKLKQSQKYLLQNKLTEANANLRSVNLKLGVENPPEPVKVSGPGPIDKFIAYVSNGQNQLESAYNQVKTLNSSGTELTPGSFLEIQVKLNKAQQQIEYSSVLLSKAVEGMKQIFNIQL